MKIELSDEIAVYTGRARGSADRKRFNLGAIDKQTESVEIIVPESTYTMTSSYFLAVFGDSIRILGRERFLQIYRIKAPPHVSRKIEDWISRALREKKGLFGGEI